MGNQRITVRGEKCRKEIKKHKECQDLNQKRELYEDDFL